MENKNTEDPRFYNAPIFHFSDRSGRWLLQNAEYVQGLLEILDRTLAEQLDFRGLTPLNRTFLSETLRQQETDVIYSVPFKSEDRPNAWLIYLLIEHQSSIDPTMQLRLLIYIAQIWDAQRQRWDAENVPISQRRLPLIVPILFYTGETTWDTPLSLTSIMDIPDELTRFVPSFDTLFLSVKEADVSTLTQTDHPFGWLLTVLQKEGASRLELSEALARALLHLSSLQGSQAAQYRRAIVYIVLLILHRGEEAET